MKKKLIEVSLPLEAINKEASREKSIRHGHPSTLHLWWARRPLATCRAVLFASLVDDPSSHPERFPTEEAQQEERERLHDLIKKLVIWDNIGDKDLYQKAYEEILKSTDGNPPPILDPFAGGGSIPLEAQRLGLEAHASDLNPVAVLINKALIEIPPKFTGKPPVNPESRAKLGGSDSGYNSVAGLASDVQYYGEWMKEQAEKRIGHLYPKVKLPNGNDATVIAWIWARTVKCPNPACGAEMPLASSFWLSKKKGKEAWVEPIFHNDHIVFKVRYGLPDKDKLTQINCGTGFINEKGKRTQATFLCPKCKAGIAKGSYIDSEANYGHMNSVGIATIVEAKNGREYLDFNIQAQQIADESLRIYWEQNDLQSKIPNEPCRGTFASNAQGRKYSFNTFADYFTPRQLTALVTFSSLIGEAVIKTRHDAVAAGLPNDNISLDDGGAGARAYGEAIGVYLACALDKGVNLWSSICSWMSDRGAMRETFARQAIPMVWDFAEANPFSNSGGNFGMFIERCVDVIKFLPGAIQIEKASVNQQDAMKQHGNGGIVISTDPPYYDNIGYADLSDFFYVWLRRSLNTVYPSLFSTMLVPKSEELVVTPYRFDGNADKARAFFEAGMLQAFLKMRVTALSDYPLTVYYAFKQNETVEDEDGENKKVVSIGWESMLQALINAKFTVTGTWPLRTESSGRAVAQNSNALASSIALVCRPRSENAPSISRRKFLTELKERLKEGLHYLQTGNIAPVDLQQAAIGPGMEVYSKYSEVLEANGTPMNLHEALVLINQELDAYLGAQEGGMDPDSRFCIAWYELHGLNAGKSGEADTLARAKLAHLHGLVSDGVLEHARGVTRLKGRNELFEKWDASRENTVWTMVQRLCSLLEQGSGMEAAAAAMRELSTPNYENLENIKSLAYRAYLAAERQHVTTEAIAYNGLVTAWPELLEKMVPEQTRLNI